MNGEILVDAWTGSGAVIKLERFGTVVADLAVVDWWVVACEMAFERLFDLRYLCGWGGGIVGWRWGRGVGF